MIVIVIATGICRTNSFFFLSFNTFGFEKFVFFFIQFRKEVERLAFGENFL